MKAILFRGGVDVYLFHFSLSFFPYPIRFLVNCLHTMLDFSNCIDGHQYVLLDFPPMFSTSYYVHISYVNVITSVI